MGEFKVCSDSCTVKSWHNKPAKLVFEYLIAKHGSPVNREALMEMLWPEQNPASAANNLKTAVYDLRDTLKELFDPKIPLVQFSQGKYLINPEIEVLTDADEFELRWRNGKKLEKTGDAETSRHEFEAAEALYHGDFLEEELYEEWTIPRREELKDIYLLLLDKLADAAINSGDYESCVTYCHKILAKDTCREDTYRMLMQCYSRLGQKQNSLRWYEKCKLTMQRELGSPLTPETESLHKRLMSGENL